jgi:hypothetical protein
MAKIKKIYDNNTYSTIPGTASWPKVVTPDTTFDDDGEWVIKLVFDADNEDVKKMQKTIVAFNKEQPDYNKDTVAYPWGPYKNDDKEVVEGKVCFKFKRKAMVKKDGKRVPNEIPRVVDSAGVPWINCPLGGGSTVQVGYQMLPYTGFGKVGISLRLVSVRVLELKEYKVEVEWGDYTGSSKAPEVSTQAPVEEEDIPVGNVDDEDDEF